MSKSKAHAQWKGTIKEGKGTISLTNFTGNYSFASRFEGADGTTPEELIGAAHAGCFSMYLSLLLTEKGMNPESIDTHSTVTIDKNETGPHITKVALASSVKCSELDSEIFDALVSQAKQNCPVSRLIAGGTAKIEVDAQLNS